MVNIYTAQSSADHDRVLADNTNDTSLLVSWWYTDYWGVSPRQNPPLHMMQKLLGWIDMHSRSLLVGLNTHESY